MDSFIEALYGETTEQIPEEYDWFAPLIGDWDFETNPQADGEYGVGLRMFNRKTLCYDMVYACESKFTRLTFTMENGILTGTIIDNPNRKWRFVERNEDTFHWQNITIQENGKITVNCEVYGKRK